MHVDLHEFKLSMNIQFSSLALRSAHPTMPCIRLVIGKQGIVWPPRAFSRSDVLDMSGVRTYVTQSSIEGQDNTPEPPSVIVF